MPMYKYPKLKEHNDDDEKPVAMDSSKETYPDKWARTITIPVNDEILDMLKVGDEVDVTLMGEVTETAKTEGDYERKSITVQISSVSAYPEEDEDAERSFEKGYGKAGGSHNSHGYG